MAGAREPCCNLATPQLFGPHVFKVGRIPTYADDQPGTSLGAAR